MKNDEELSDQAKRLRKARESRGFVTAADAIRFFGFVGDTYKGHESGSRGLTRSAGRYATAFRVSEAWLLTGEGESPESPQVPVLGFAAGSLIGENVVHDTAIEYAKCPPALENVKNAYALRVRGKSMEPQFYENDIVFVHPNKNPKPGDTIIIQQQAMGEIHAFIKRFKSQTNGNLVATQHNPIATVEYPLKSVIALHRVLTLNELFGL